MNVHIGKAMGGPGTGHKSVSTESRDALNTRKRKDLFFS